jgi:hypothetical protein
MESSEKKELLCKFKMAGISLPGILRSDITMTMVEFFHKQQTIVLPS